MACRSSLTVVRSPHARKPGRHSGHGAYYFFIVIVIRHETTAAARWALLLIVRTVFNDAITVAIWTGFHVCLSASIAVARWLARGETVSRTYEQAGSPPARERIIGASDFAHSLLVTASFVRATAPIALTRPFILADRPLVR